MSRTRRPGRKTTPRPPESHPARLEYVARWVRTTDLVEALEAAMPEGLLSDREKHRIARAVDQALFLLANSRPKLRDF